MRSDVCFGMNFYVRGCKEFVIFDYRHSVLSKALDTSYLKIALYYCHLRLNVGAVK